MKIENGRVLALQAIDDYLQEKAIGTGDRYGQFHGEMGKLRAKKMKIALENPLVIKDPAAILAIFMALFGPPTGFCCWYIGRSSKLASFIADRWIKGEYTPGSQHDTLNSEVIPSHLLDATKSKDVFRVVPNGEASYSYFDKTQAVRYCLQETINNDYKAERSYIKRSADTLRAFFENIRAYTMYYSFFPHTTLRKQARVKGAITSMLKQPPAIGNLIGSFVGTGHQEALSCLKVNKKSYIAAQEKEINTIKALRAKT